MRARRASLAVAYNGIDITADLAPHLLGWTYTDNLSGEADDLQLMLEDVDQLWSGDWMPEEGATLTASVRRENWDEAGTADELALGQFEIDEVEVGSPPSTATIKGVSVPETSSLRGEAKHRAWEAAKLSVILRDVASKAGLEVFYDTQENPEYDRVEQSGETDLAFVMRLCVDAGLCLKVSDAQLVVFDERKYEEAEPSDTIVKGDSRIKSYRGRRALAGTYRACRVAYHDPVKNTTIKASFAPPSPPNTGRVLAVNERVQSIAEAQRLARNRLRQANREAVTFTLSLTGATMYVAGQTILLNGFGWFDGKYIIVQTTHSQQSGFETRLQLRKCLEGY